MGIELGKFTREETLNSSINNISLALLGKIEEERAIVLLNKVAFQEDTDIAFEDIKKIQENDIYASGTVNIRDSVKYSIICPASDFHISKYSKNLYVMVRETYELYKDKVLPIALSKGSSTKWIDNLFAEAEGKTAPFVTETNEEVLHIDDQFLIAPDFKWDRTTMNSLYLLVVFKDKSLYTLREITPEHLPLLERAKAAVEKVLKEKYNTPINETKLYFHYYPTFYQLHIHVTSVKSTYPGMNIGSSVLLHDVIDNLKILPDYYKRKTMEICISTKSYLYQAYEQ